MFNREAGCLRPVMWIHITGFFMPHNQYHHIIILCASPQLRRKILRLPSKYVQLTIPIPFPSNSGMLSRETQDFASPE